MTFLRYIPPIFAWLSKHGTYRRGDLYRYHFKRVRIADFARFRIVIKMKGLGSLWAALWDGNAFRVKYLRQQKNQGCSALHPACLRTSPGLAVFDTGLYVGVRLVNKVG